MRTQKRLFILALAMVTAGGCDDSWSDDSGDEHQCVPVSNPVESAAGALSQGRFKWICVNSGDPTCGSRSFPNAVAAGARFNLDFSTNTSLPAGVGDPRLSAIGDALVDSGSGFSAPVPGVATVVAVSEEAAIDFIEVEVLSVTRLTLSRTLPEPTADEWGCTPGDPRPSEGERPDLFLGENFAVQVMPYAGSTRLSGSLEYTWESLTPEILFVSETGGRVARIDGLSEGVGRLVVRGGGHEETFEVRVDAVPIEDPPETGDGSTGGDDGSTGGDDGSTTGDDGSTSGGSTSGGSTSGGETSGGTE